MDKYKRRIIVFTGIGLIFIIGLASIVKGFGINNVKDNTKNENKDIKSVDKKEGKDEKSLDDREVGEESRDGKDNISNKNIKYTEVDLKIRKNPSTNGEVIGTIPKGKEVEIAKTEGDWDKVRYKDLEGYSANKYLEEGPTYIKGVLLVNREHSVPADYFKEIDPEAKKELSRMLKAAKDEEGLDLITHSDHRTHNDQKILFENYAARDGYDKAYKYSAQPGQSEHETGLAFDICDINRKYYLKEAFGESREGIWLGENAHRFGFILRYPKDKTHITGFIYEPWHFRYVGREHAAKIYEKELTLEEYLLPDKY